MWKLDVEAVKVKTERKTQEEENTFLKVEVFS